MGKHKPGCMCFTCMERRAQRAEARRQFLEAHRAMVEQCAKENGVSFSIEAEHAQRIKDRAEVENLIKRAKG